MVCRSIISGASGVIFASVLIFSNVVAQPSSDKTRMERFNKGYYQSNQGKLDEAAAIFREMIEQTPCAAEATAGLLDVCFKEIAADSAFVFLHANQCRSGKYGKAYRWFVSGYEKLYGRKFEQARSSFESAAELFNLRGDRLSAVFSYLGMAESCLGGREANCALRSIEKAKEQLNAILVDGSAAVESRLFTPLIMKATSIEAKAFNLMDRLDAADSMFSIVISRSDAEQFRGVLLSSLNGKAKIEEKRQRFEQALSLYGRAMKLAEETGDKMNRLVILNNLGQVEISAGETEKAREYLSKAEQLALRYKAGWILGYVYYGMGAIAEKEGNQDKAMEFFEESVEKHKKGGNSWGELGARLRVGYILSEMGEYSRAISEYQHCLQAYREMKSLYGQSWALGGLALANHNMGNLDQAEKYYRSAREVREELGDKRGVAWSLNFLGMVLDMKGRYSEALASEFEALELYREQGDSTGVGMAHFSIGTVYFYLGDYQEAMKHYQRAFHIATFTGDDDLKKRVASGMGSIYSLVGSGERVRELYSGCAEMSRREGDKPGMIWSWNNLAGYYIGLGQQEEASQYLDKVLDLLPGEGMNHLRARAYYLISKVKGSPEDAIEWCEQALSHARGSGLQELVWKSASDLGVLYLAAGDTSKAESMQKEAIEVIESLRWRVGSNELRRHMLEPAILPYERMVSMILKASRNPYDVLEAFGYTERSRAQIISGLLLEASAMTGNKCYRGVTQDEERLISRISYLQADLQKSDQDTDKRKKLVEKIEVLEREFDGLRARIAAESMDYTSTAYPRVEKPEVLLETLKPGEKMLSYYFGDRNSYLFVGSKDDIEFYLLPPRGEIEQQVRYFLRLFRQSAHEREADADGGNDETQTLPAEVISEAKREMERLLISPVEDLIHRDETIIIIPDGLLHYFPFAYLEVGGEFLAEKCNVFYAPSLRSLYYLRKRRESRKDYNPGIDIIAVGCRGSVQKGGEEKGRLFPFKNVEVKPLHHAPEEAKAVADQFPMSLVLTDVGASESSFKQQPIGDSRILHFAAHSYIDDQEVSRSFILLNSEGGNEPVSYRHGKGDSSQMSVEDGLLQWHEITSLNLNSSLVALSACRSAGGVLSRGEGINGLVQAFLYAGSDCVLASTVDIPDRLARELMIKFYHNLAGDMSVSGALRESQLEFITENKAIEQGGMWAGFVVVGDGSVVIEADKREGLPMWLAPVFGVAIAFVLVVLVLIFYRRRRV
jgi:CHAT domain-containing protein/tetratricopeptide (TPR) repeat protein